MLRTPKREVELNVSSCKIVNDGFPFLRVTCETILVTPEQRRIILNEKSWFLDGAGGPIKVINVPQLLQRHHMPSANKGVQVNTAVDVAMADESAFSTGNGHFTTDLVVDLHLPRGVIDIQFARYSDEMEMRRRAMEEEETARRKEMEAIAAAQETARKKAEKQSSVNAFRRKFDNLDLDNDGNE
jgi:hypothetical protein